MFRSPSLLTVFLVVILFAFIGCNDDELTTPPLGMVVIDGGPEPLATPWTLRVANGLFATGSGDSTLLNMTPGTYTLTWGEVEGWETPDPAESSQSLKDDNSLRFTGTYSRAERVAGVIVVDPDPSELQASWVLTGPDDFSVASTGDSIFYDLSLGDYALTWGEVEGWNSPDPAAWSDNLANGERLQVTGVYTEMPGRIVVNPEPDAISAPWHINGPDTLITGSGDLTLTDLVSGSYSIVWEDVSGWSTPDSLEINLMPGGDVTFTTEYIRKFTLVSAGTFTMGSNNEFDETPHTVTLSNDFQIGTTEITNQEFCDMIQWALDNDLVGVGTGADVGNIIDVIGSARSVLYNYDSDYSDINYNLGEFTCDRPRFPVKELSWFGAAAYCDWLNRMEGSPDVYDHDTWDVIAGDVYAATGWRLPTEAEWEYACRGGTTTRFGFGDCLSADTDANFFGSSPIQGCPVSGNVGDIVQIGLYQTNGFELLDMHGNVSEWCWDTYEDDYYAVSPGTNPVGPAAGALKVVRGGSFADGAYDCRSAARSFSDRNNTRSFIGFRIAKTN